MSIGEGLAFVIWTIILHVLLQTGLIICVVVLFVKTYRLKRRVADLEITLYDKSFAAASAQTPQPESKAPSKADEAFPREIVPEAISEIETVLTPPQPEPTFPINEAVIYAPKQETPAPRNLLSPLFNYLKGGNIWVTAGFIFVVLGFTFFYLYISRIYHIPAEIKVGAGALFGLALFIFAFIKRGARPAFSLIMQGGGLGIMYLAFFAGFKIYKILPAELTFSLLVILVAAAALMALLQDSEAMAFFSAVTGFAAPVLLSTGSNNYIALFSFYSVLNICVLAAAFKKYWRYLNGVSFLCTYAVGVMWANKYYVPENFIHILIFSTIFFIIYTLVNFLSVSKTGNRKVENLFAVATPFAYMATLLFIARHFQYGQAIAAFSIGIFYFLIYMLISRFKAEAYRSLAALYLPFTLIFLNFSIPLALSGDWTSAIWALEGAMLTVMGGRQKNSFFRFFGLILIFGALRYEPDTDHFSSVFLNSAFICRLLTAAAMLIAAGVLRLQKDWEKKYLSYIILSIGVILWYSRLVIEIQGNSEEVYKGLFYLVIFSVSGFIFAYGGKKLGWFLPQTLAFSPVIAAVLVTCFDYGQLFFVRVTNFHWAGWLVFILVQASLMYVYRGRAINKRIILVHALSVFFAVSLAGEALSYGFYVLLNPGDSDSVFVTHRFFLLAVFAVFIMSLLKFNRRGVSLFGRNLSLESGCPKEVLSVWKVYGAGFITAYMLYTLLILGSSVYQIWDISTEVKTLPVLNTADAASLIIVVSMLFYFAWLFKNRELPVKFRGALKWIRGLAVFFWANALLGRAVFYMSEDMGYSFSWLMDSAAYQLAIAVLWGLAGFAFIAYGFKKFRKTYWTIGAAVLAVDAVKLLLIDLSRVDTMQRILSFLGVGLIFIAIGYFFPLPRKLPEEAEKMRVKG
jgi:uncharacterized membrane protein